MLISHPAFLKEGLGEESHGGGRVTKKGKGKAASGKLGPPSDKLWCEKWRKELKLAGRQFQRLVEMLILRSLDPADMLAAKKYRLQVKERLYRFNFVSVFLCRFFKVIEADWTDDRTSSRRQTRSKNTRCSRRRSRA
jgi:hypothetical protein